MPTVTKIFNYTGTTQVVTVPAGTSELTVHLWGGAGGGGGGDQAGPGRTGAAGHYLKFTSANISAYVGQQMKVAVGGGGAGGTSGGSAPGGTNGKSLTGYSGGIGGTSGPNGMSGAGGGGGGATLITFNGVEYAVAGGGGAGAGDGRNGIGTAGINTNSATSESPSTLGENGASHTGDGGGGGAGGGGAAGGRGGDGGSGDNGGTGGYSGSNSGPAGATDDNGTGQVPAGTGVSYYSTGIARGGDSGSSGGNGKAVLIFTVDVNAKYKVSGEWKDINDMYYKVSGAWKKITAAYTKVSGTWKALFNSGIDFTSTAAGFGDASGNSASGTPGSGGGGGGGRVICTWLQNKGMMSLADLLVDCEYSNRYISRTTKIGYWLWAVPLVNKMDEWSKNDSKFGKYFIKFIHKLAQSRANEIAYAMGKTNKRDLLGVATRLCGEPTCWLLGLITKPFVDHKYGDYVEVFDPEIR